MADHAQLAHQLARSVLRYSDQYAEAKRLGVARRWLSREGDDLAARLMDEAWRWTPRSPDPDAFRREQES